MLTHKVKIEKCSFPKQSLLTKEAIYANFHDSYVSTSIEKKFNPLEIYLLMVNNTPAWINTLLSLRNKAVQLVGLKDVGNLGNINFIANINPENLPGTQLDIFVVEAFSENEMILIQKDKHLDIKLSILIDKNVNCFEIIVSTVVNFHNYLGKFYMFVITPFHKIIVKRLLKNISYFS